MIRLLVVDEHPVVGEGIRAILHDEPDISVETATDVSSAIDAPDASSPDVVLSEIHLQGDNSDLHWVTGASGLCQARTGKGATHPRPAGGAEEVLARDDL